MNTQKPTLPPLPSSTSLDTDANLDSDLRTLDDILGGPAPDGEPCPHCGGPDCPGGDDDPCVQACWAMCWEEELKEIAKDQCGDPANEDEVAQ